MGKNNDSYLELFVMRLRAALTAYRVPYTAAMLVGLAAYMYAFTNKLVNHDDIMCLFSFGSSLSSGRWGLKLFSALFPGGSLPWLHGIASLLMASAAICLMLSILEIKNRLVQAVLAAVTVSFPAQMDTFCYMFVSSAYACSLLLSVLSVWVFTKERKGHWIISILMLTLSVSIYQSYLSVASGLMVLSAVRMFMDGEKTKTILKRGTEYIAVLGLSVAAYYAVMKLLLLLSGSELNGYATVGRGLSGTIQGLKQAYLIFPRLFFREYFGYVTGSLSRIMHCLCLLVTGIECVLLFVRTDDWKRRLLFAFLLIIFPLSIAFMYLITETVHTLVLYSFVAVYLFFGMLADGRIAKSRIMEKDILLTAMLLITVSNIYFANSVYLKLHLQYENAMAFYTSVVTQIKSEEGFTEGCSVAIIGNADTAVYKPPIDDHYLAGMYPTLINVYSRDDFIRQYVGFCVRFATAEEKGEIKETDEFAAMASYPYYGSIKRIGDFMVVKLS